MFMDTKSKQDFDNIGERELWITFKNDNREAFSALFLRSYEKLYRYGMNLTGNKGQVKDSIQKLFYRLWDKRKVIDTPQSVYGYLYVSLRRILLRVTDKQTKRNKRNAKFLKEETDLIFSIEDEIIFEEKKREKRELYKKAIKTLTPRQKEALLLRINNGMSNAEISNIMDISEKRVRNLIYEATSRLRRSIYELTD